MADHNHHHDHDHDFTEPPSEVELRVKALESLLVDKGLIEQATIDALVDTFENKVGPSNGKRVVGRAWADPEFKRWLLESPTAAIASMGYESSHGEHMRVVENTEDVHNLVVCTLCSCYPWPVLGLPPVWYKSAPYRSQAVADPRGVLRQFGTELSDDIEVRVWDSTSEMRFLVLPQRPSGTEGWTEEQLAELVTRNSMIGVEKARVPVPAPLPSGRRTPVPSPLPSGRRTPVPSPLPSEGRTPVPSPLPSEGRTPVPSPLPSRGRTKEGV